MDEVKRTKRALKIGAVGLVVATLAACAPLSQSAASSSPASAAKEVVSPQYESAQQVVDAYDVTKLCGKKPVKIGFLMTVNVTWYQQVYQMVKDEAAKCPNVTIVFSDAQGSQQTAVSNVNSLVAQGISGILTFPVFGQAMVPAFRKAMDAGVPVATFVAKSGGVVGKDVAAEVTIDEHAIGEMYSDWLKKNVKSGTIVYLGTAAGQPSTIARFKQLDDALKGTGLKFVEDGPIATNNDAQQTLQAMQGLLAKHGRIDVVVSDYGATSINVTQAYKAAGYKPPTIVNTAPSNGVGCDWEKERYPLFSLDGQQTNAVVAFRKLLAAVNKLDDPEANVIRPFVVNDTTIDKNPKCVASLAPGIDWSTNLTDEENQKAATQ